MSWTSPASACSRSVPPPQDWKTSGTFPPCMVVVSLALNASFSSTVMWIFTLGCAAMYWSAAFFQIDLSGSLLAMCHHSMVTGLPPDDLLALLSLLPESLPQPAATSAAATSAPRAQRIDFTID